MKTEIVRSVKLMKFAREVMGNTETSRRVEYHHAKHRSRPLIIEFNHGQKCVVVKVPYIQKQHGIKKTTFLEFGRVIIEQTTPNKELYKTIMTIITHYICTPKPCNEKQMRQAIFDHMVGSQVSSNELASKIRNYGREAL